MSNFLIKYTYQAIDNFSPIAKKIGERVKENAERFKALAKDIKKAKEQFKEFNSVAKKIGQTMLVAGAVMGAALLMPIKQAAELEAKLSALKAITGSTLSEMKAYKNMARSVSDLGYNATQATEAITELAKAGVSAKDIMNGGLRGALYLAVAGEIGVADAAEIASTALNAFRRDNLNVVQAADILAGAANASATDIARLKMGLSQSAAVASAAGISFKDTATALAVFAQNGLQGSDAGTSLKTMLMNLQPRSDEQIATFVQLGLATGKLVKVTRDGTPKFKLMSNLFYDSKDKMKSMAEISEVLRTKLAHLTDKQRGYALETIFGSDAIRAANILYKEGAKGLDDMAAAMGKVKIADVATEKINNFQGGVNVFGALMYNIGASLGEAFLPALKAIVKGLSFLAKSFDSLPQGIKSFIAISIALTSGLLLLGGIIGTFIIPAITTLIATWGALTAAFAAGGALSGLSVLIGGIGVLFSTINAPMLAFGALITAIIVPVVAALAGLFSGLWGGFMEGIAPAMPAIKQLAGTLKTVLGGALNWLLTPLKLIFEYASKIGSQIGSWAGDKIGNAAIALNKSVNGKNVAVQAVNSKSTIDANINLNAPKGTIKNAKVQTSGDVKVGGNMK